MSFAPPPFFIAGPICKNVTNNTWPSKIEPLWLTCFFFPWKPVEWKFVMCFEICWTGNSGSEMIDGWFSMQRVVMWCLVTCCHPWSLTECPWHFCLTVTGCVSLAQELEVGGAVCTSEARGVKLDVAWCDKIFVYTERFIKGIVERVMNRLVFLSRPLSSNCYHAMHYILCCIWICCEFVLEMKQKIDIAICCCALCCNK